MLDNFEFHHIGYAVRNIEVTASFYTEVGWSLSDVQIDPQQKTRIAFLKRENFPMIELVAPVDEKSPINDTLRKMGVSTYHVCYMVPDIDGAVRELRNKRFLALFKPIEAVALGNRKICYMMHPQVGLIELLEK